MAAIILVNPDCPEMAYILEDEEGNNFIFESVIEADDWCEKNITKLVGFSTVKILELDE